MNRDGAVSKDGYQVIAIRFNGKRLVVSKHDCREGAERVLRLIRYGFEFTKVYIAPRPERPQLALATCEQPPKNKTGPRRRIIASRAG
jgi:hypothetical protein